MGFSSPYYENVSSLLVQNANVNLNKIEVNVLVPLAPHDRRYDANSNFCLARIEISGIVSVPYEIYERAYDIKGLTISDDFRREKAFVKRK